MVYIFSHSQLDGTEIFPGKIRIGTEFFPAEFFPDRVFRSRYFFMCGRSKSLPLPMDIKPKAKQKGGLNSSG
jgi:hypothetical protein